MKSLAPALLGIAVIAGLSIPTPTQAQTAGEDALRFAADNYQLQTIEANGERIRVRAYEGIRYVANPVDASRQVMNIYIPAAYFEGGEVAGKTAERAPIFLPNQIGGYMPAAPGTANAPARGPGAGRVSTIAQALMRGYVVASPGARGRSEENGKAPAAIVDLKAAVRWLRYNDARMPGDAERIISNGTSAGGALSALLGASGNHPDYEAALQQLGAAPAGDDVFAVSAYCPITNLEHADAAYEWLFNGVNDYKKISIRMLDYNVQRQETAGTLDAAQIGLSDALKPLFPPYLNSLGLKDAGGQPLQLADDGRGSFAEHIARLVTQSAQTALDAGQDLSGTDWLDIADGKVAQVDLAAYARGIGRMKTPPAFDAVDLSSGENQLFGGDGQDSRHFTDFSMRHSTAEGGQRAPAEQVRLMNPLNYIGDAAARNAQHWRIRHGSHDRDTAVAVPAILAARLAQQGHAVDFALPWGQGHGGDYDLDALFDWMDKISTAEN